MRILYGVTGEGLGHAMRSRVVASHLRSQGHEVKLVASSRAFDYLGRYFTDIHQIPGFALAYSRGGIARLRSARRIGRSARAALRESAELYRRPIAGFQPDACITDFDSFSHVFGLLFDRPVISVDHHHVIDRCRHAREIRRGMRRELAFTRAVVRAKLPGCHHYVVTSFYRPPVKRRDTTLVGPILRPEVLGLEPTRGDHVLVYQTATRDLVAPLYAIPEQRFVVYGCGDGGTTANVTLRPFDEARFLADLASARAVILNGGYTLMSEALFLGKPVLSVPLRRHGEQQLNAAYLAALGLGRSAPYLDDLVIRDFLATCEPIERVAPGNSAALSTIDHLLQEIT
ncbi:MAG: UDP-glucuronosyltransferase [Kofleriaceae bacterium]|nr:UDP-glucuronosyltransferase [Kofleriaceae bacterium]